MVTVTGTFDDIIVTPEQASAGLTATHGYLEYRVTVANRSKDQAHHVQLSLGRQGYGYGFGHYLQGLSRTVEVSPGATVKVSLFQPDNVW